MLTKFKIYRSIEVEVFKEWILKVICYMYSDDNIFKDSRDDIKWTNCEIQPNVDMIATLDVWSWSILVSCLLLLNSGSCDSIFTGIGLLSPIFKEAYAYHYLRHWFIRVYALNCRYTFPLTMIHEYLRRSIFFPLHCLEVLKKIVFFFTRIL